MADERRLTICFPFSGDSIGGSHVSVLGLLKRLDQRRFRLVIVPEVAGGAIARMFEDFEVLTDPGARGTPVAPGQPFTAAKILSTFGSVPPRARFLLQQGVDIVHSNDGRSHANWALAARLAGAKLLWHHRADPHALGLRLAAPLLASRVLTVSRFALPSPGLWSAAARAEVAHSPFETSMEVSRALARNKLVSEFGLPGDTLILGFFGNFVRRKRPLLFVDAVAQVAERLGRPVAGLMFGEAIDPAIAFHLQERLAQPNAGSVRLAGFRPNGAQLIAGCDQLLVPAVREPFGRTLIEAMLVGTPVIAARSGGNIEALEDGSGILVQADDPAALANASMDLANAPGHAQLMAERAQARARRKFSARRHAERVSEIYEELTSGVRQPAANRELDATLARTEA